MSEQHNTYHEIPEELGDTQVALDALGQADRASMPEALVDRLAATPPTSIDSSVGVLARIRPVLAVAAMLALLATSLVLWQSRPEVPDEVQDDFFAAMQEEDDLFADVFDEAFDSFATELAATEQLFATWDASQLWDDSDSLWQEVVP